MTKKITDFKPQQKNVNQHSLHGTRLLEKSVQRDGWISAMTAAADEEIFDGSNRINLAAEKFVDKDGKEVEPIIVHTTGDRPVIVVRDDIPTASDPRAKRLSVAANQITATDWNPDGDLLKEWAAEDADIKALFSPVEWLEVTNPKQEIDYKKEWEGMPEFETKDLRAVKQILVSFASMKDYEDFQELIGQKLTEKAKYVWYPKAEILHQSLVIENDES